MGSCSRTDPARRAFLKQAGAAVGLAALAPHGGALAQGGLSGIDLAMTEFLAERKVPGASLAVARAGRLVHARGYGVADRETGEAVRPESLFRIASVSKPVTAVAVLRLAEQGRLSLDTPVWEFLGLATPSDTRWKQVTILHLLHHTGGWDRDKSFDPMFRSPIIAAALQVPPPAGATEVIRYMLGQPLDFDPGSRFAYSNFGYCLLGRVIERATGKTYEMQVRDDVLAPLGIRRMRLGRTLREHRAPGEVSYYDERNRVGPAVTGTIGAPVPLPYGRWVLESMDAHGGWIATAADLVRFASAFDLPERSPLLSPAGVATMFARPPGPAGAKRDDSPQRTHYGCGWDVRPYARLDQPVAWHTGSLAGTSTLLMRGHHRLNIAVLLNTRAGPDGRLLDSGIAQVLLNAALRVHDWPETDLFPALL